MSVTIILVGGLGKRMSSPIPKVLHLIKDKPMIYYVIQNAIIMGSSKILIVVGKFRSMIQEQIDIYFPNSELFEYINQPEALGTGHAIKCCIPYFIENRIPKHYNVAIISGDVPLLSSATLLQLCSLKNSLLITNSETPIGCGRICFDKNHNIVQIIEEKDCTNEQKKIQYINCGIYHITVDTLLETVPHITNQNAANEYYLTDFVELALKKDYVLQYYELPKEDQYQIININTTDDLVKANLLADDLIHNV